MDGPASSYSCLLIHICWKVDREARMEPPIQTEYFLSGGAMIYTKNKKTNKELCVIVRWLGHYIQYMPYVLQARLK